MLLEHKVCYSSLKDVYMKQFKSRMYNDDRNIIIAVSYDDNTNNLYLGYSITNLNI